MALRPLDGWTSGNRVGFTHDPGDPAHAQSMLCLWDSVNPAVARRGAAWEPAVVLGSLSSIAPGSTSVVDLVVRVGSQTLHIEYNYSRPVLRAGHLSALAPYLPASVREHPWFRRPLGPPLYGPSPRHGSASVDLHIPAPQGP